jgi:hypothetical protein
MDIDGYRPAGERESRCLLNGIIRHNTDRLKRLALKHKRRARAEAAERTRRLGFDPGAEADKVRRYEDASFRRMTRVCDDLAKLRRSGILDEDGNEERELPGPARGWEPRPACESCGDITNLDRREQPGSGDAGESIAKAEETNCNAPPPMSETTVHGPTTALHGEVGEKSTSAQETRCGTLAPMSKTSDHTPQTAVNANRPAAGENSVVASNVTPRACPWLLGRRPFACWPLPRDDHRNANRSHCGRRDRGSAIRSRASCDRRRTDPAKHSHGDLCRSCRLRRSPDGYRTPGSHDRRARSERRTRNDA